jgi:hypothetical protein
MTEPFRVSDSTIETAARAGYEYDGDFDAPWPDAGERMRDGYRDGMRVAFAAVLPSLVAEIREQIAGEIEADALFQETAVGFDLGQYATGMRRAAFLARGDAG